MTACHVVPALFEFQRLMDVPFTNSKGGRHTCAQVVNISVSICANVNINAAGRSDVKYLESILKNKILVLLSLCFHNTTVR